MNFRVGMHFFKILFFSVSSFSFVSSFLHWHKKPAASAAALAAAATVEELPGCGEEGYRLPANLVPREEPN